MVQSPPRQPLRLWTCLILTTAAASEEIRVTLRVVHSPLQWILVTDTPLQCSRPPKNCLQRGLLSDARTDLVGFFSAQLKISTAFNRLQ